MAMNTDRPPDLSGDMSTGEWSPEAMRAREERRVIAAARRYECLRCGRAIIGTAYEGCHANLLICEANEKSAAAASGPELPPPSDKHVVVKKGANAGSYERDTRSASRRKGCHANLEIKRAVYYLLVLVYLDLAGVRMLTAEELRLAEDISAWMEGRRA